MTLLPICRDDDLIQRLRTMNSFAVNATRTKNFCKSLKQSEVKNCSIGKVHWFNLCLHKCDLLGLGLKTPIMQILTI